MLEMYSCFSGLLLRNDHQATPALVCAGGPHHEQATAAGTNHEVCVSIYIALVIQILESGVELIVCKFEWNDNEANWYVSYLLAVGYACMPAVV
jgi:hypothetical protein